MPALRLLRGAVLSLAFLSSSGAVSELVIDAPARIEMGGPGSPAVLVAESDGAGGTALRVEGALKADVMKVGGLNVGDQRQRLSSRSDLLDTRMRALEGYMHELEQKE